MTLAEFHSAPAPIQAAFFAELGRRLAADREENAALRELHDVEIADSHFPLAWDAGWRRRARAVRRAQAHPDEDWTPNRDEDPLREIPARDYIEALTGEEVPASGTMRCVLPDHEDRDPSFYVYDGGGWRCFGCGRSGTIYDLASALWDIEPRGRGFVEIHKRLRTVFGS